ncbi:MAG: CNNM domain-containing protein [Verrucomicrobiota bacterium]|jgi:putative hemolysin|nr:CNNM domain-containing protein [Verrucomicrobiota bacterium]MDD8045404.1 CNNM domain-containing protein [Verrucomicrobiota bacterium]MDD8051324.1 CNNM domain-containing protein [Verrucomicrobiota bacterium]MDI9383717.1 CNNM domain-containing protein [Verrucomicrobiota bacterium]
MIPSLILGFFFLLGSGFYSGLETAIVSLHRARVRSHFDRGSRRAKILEDFLRDREKLLTTTLLGTNLCNVSASVMAVRLGEPWGAWGEAVAGGIVFVLLLLFGEFLPKVMFRRHPTRLALMFAYPIWWSFVLFKPVIVVVTALARGLLVLLGIHAASGNPMVTREELKLLIRRGELAGTLTSKERELVHAVIDTRGKRVRDIMLSMEKAEWLPADATIDQACRRCKESGRSRVPLVERVQGGFTVVGVFNLYDILFGLDHTSGTDLALTVARPPRFLAPDTTLSMAMQRLRSGRQPIALIGNETDRSAMGLITVEDLLRVLVGRVEA